MTVTGKVVKAENKLDQGLEWFADRFVNLFASITTLIFAIVIIGILAAIVFVIVQLFTHGIRLIS